MKIPRKATKSGFNSGFDLFWLCILETFSVGHLSYQTLNFGVFFLFFGDTTLGDLFIL